MRLKTRISLEKVEAFFGEVIDTRVDSSSDCTYIVFLDVLS